MFGGITPAMLNRCFYNEIEPYAVKWLSNLIDAEHLPFGDIDDRSIAKLWKEDIDGYGQAHFFAGIGGWPLALRLAGWPDDRPVWTGSCPCQPFSVAGRHGGTADERHLWPQFYRLITECRPPVIFGEQVASKDGCLWLAGVRTDLEALEYAVGAADLCAAGVGAPHIRQRLFWVADASGNERRTGWNDRTHAGGEAQPSGFRASGKLGDALGAGLQERSQSSGRRELGYQGASPEPSGFMAGPWCDAEFILCRDGRQRRFEPRFFPLVDGVPNRVGRLRAYGNAIVPPLAVEFIKAYMECQTSSD